MRSRVLRTYLRVCAIILSVNIFVFFIVELICLYETQVRKYTQAEHKQNAHFSTKINGHFLISSIRFKVRRRHDETTETKCAWWMCERTTDSGGTGVSFGACTFLGIGTRTWRVSKDGIGMKPDLWCY